MNVDALTPTDPQTFVFPQPVVLPAFAFSPFPTCSVTLVPAPTFTGKSWLVKQLLLHQQLYFPKPLTRVIVVLCNPKAAVFELGEEEEEFNRQAIKLTSVSLDNFDPENLLPNDFVVFEDVQFLTDHIRITINILAHHVGLSAVFILCQGILGSKIFELLTYCHQIVLFMQSTSVARLANYIVQQFYQDKDLKEYLKTCIAYAERKKTVLLLEINSISSKQRGHHIAISHLQQLMDKQNPFAVVHPHPGRLVFYQKKFGECRTDFADNNDGNNDDGNDNNDNNNNDTAENDAALQMSALPLPPSSFLLVPAQNVTLATKLNKNSADDATSLLSPHCDRWQDVVDNIQDMIEQNFNLKKWMTCKNLAREILRNKSFCLSEEGRMLHLKNPSGKESSSLSSSTSVPLLDFIMAATKQQSPNERTNPNAIKHFVPFVKALLKNHCPEMYFKNKTLLAKGKGGNGGNYYINNNNTHNFNSSNRNSKRSSATRTTHRTMSQYSQKQFRKRFKNSSNNANNNNKHFQPYSPVHYSPSYSLSPHHHPPSQPPLRPYGNGNGNGGYVNYSYDPAMFGGGGSGGGNSSGHYL